MAELTIRPEEIRDALARFVETYEPDAASTEEIGIVAECGDGIAHVEGLPSAMANELLEFEDGTRGLALNLDISEIGVVVLGEHGPGRIDGYRKQHETNHPPHWLHRSDRAVRLTRTSFATRTGWPT